MVNIKTPKNPVHQRGLWPPKNFRIEYKVTDTDNWWNVAEKFNLDAWDLIDFNFATRDPMEVNWYLRELVGCRLTGPRGKNYSFRGADSSKRRIYIPLGKPAPGETTPPPPTQDPLEKVLDRLEEQVSSTDDPRKSRYMCMLKKLDSGADDRVVFWGDVAPDHRTPTPLGQWRRNPAGKRGVDVEWFYENIKDWKDVDRQPVKKNWLPTTGTLFVTSLRGALVSPIDAELINFRSMHDDMVRTHQILQKWSDIAIGGSSTMPREYRALHEWVRRQSNKKDTVMNCVISSGT